MQPVCTSNEPSQRLSEIPVKVSVLPGVSFGRAPTLILPAGGEGFSYSHYRRREEHHSPRSSPTCNRSRHTRACKLQPPAQDTNL